MIDHISIAVRDIKAAEVFYTALLAPLGLTKLREWPNAAIGYGKKYPEFWINRRSDMAPVVHGSGVHICLRALSTDVVDAFHTAALACGGTSDGLVPVVAGSGGADGLVSAPGVDCRGGVACASCEESPAMIWFSESAVMTSPSATSMDANSMSRR